MVYLHRKRSPEVLDMKPVTTVSTDRCQPKAPPIEPTCKHANTRLQCSTLSKDEVKAFYKKFYYTRDREVQDAFILKHCEGRSPRIKRTAGVRKRRRNVSALYFVSTRERRVRVCRSAFAGILRVKDYRINHVLKMFHKEKEEEVDIIKVPTYVSQYPNEKNKTKKKVTFASKSHCRHLGTETSFFLSAHSPITEESYLSNNDDLFNTAKHFSTRDLLDLTIRSPESIETSLSKEPIPINLNKDELKKHIDNIYSLDISDEQSVIVEKNPKQRKLKSRKKKVKENYKNIEDIPSSQESIVQDEIHTILGSEREKVDFEVPHLRGNDSRITDEFSEKTDCTILAAKQQIDLQNKIGKESIGDDNDLSEEKEEKLSLCDFNEKAHLQRHSIIDSNSRNNSVRREKNEEIERNVKNKENRSFIIRMESLSKMMGSFDTPVDNIQRRGQRNSNLKNLSSKKTSKENPKRLTYPVENTLKDNYDNVGEQDAINNKGNDNFSNIKINKFNTNTAVNSAKKSNESCVKKKLPVRNEENNKITKNVFLCNRKVIQSSNTRNQFQPTGKEDPPLDNTTHNIKQLEKGDNVSPQETMEKETGSLEIKECAKTKTVKSNSRLQTRSISNCLALSGSRSEHGLRKQSYNSVMAQDCHKSPSKHLDEIRRNQVTKNIKCSAKEKSLECIEPFEDNDNTEFADNISNIRKIKRDPKGRLSSPLRDNAALIQNPLDKNYSFSQTCPNKKDTAVCDNTIRKDPKASKQKGRNSSPLRDHLSLSGPNEKYTPVCLNRAENKSVGRKQKNRKSSPLREETCLLDDPKDHNAPLHAQDVLNSQSNNGKNSKSGKHKGRKSSPSREKVSLIEGPADQNDSTLAQNFPNKKDKMGTEDTIDKEPKDNTPLLSDNVNNGVCLFEGSVDQNCCLVVNQATKKEIIESNSKIRTMSKGNKNKLKKCSLLSDKVNLFDEPMDGNTQDQNIPNEKDIVKIESDDEKDKLNRTFTLLHPSPGQTAELNVKLFENKNELKLYRPRKFNWSSPKSKKVRDLIDKKSRPPKYTPFAENDDENKSSTESNDDGTVFKCPIGTVTKIPPECTKPDATISIYTTCEPASKESLLLDDKRRNIASRRLKAYSPSEDKENMPHREECTQDENNCPSNKITNDLEVLPKKRVFRSRLGRRNLVKNETNEENSNPVSKSRVPLQVLQM